MQELILEETNYKEQMDKVVMPYLEERRTEIWLEREKDRKLYCACYTADNARGIVMISHGFTETAEKYWECIYYFLKKEYDVYCLEHCGHGHSYRLTDDLCLVHTECFERYVYDLIFAAKKIRANHADCPLFLYAHSMGGGIGAAAAAMEPELFDKLILSSPMIRPLTKPVPWALARIIAEVSCLTGKGTHYVSGQKSYSGPELFENSAAASKERFAYYQEKRCNTPQYQMNAASYGWLKSAGRLNWYLLQKGWKQIKAPILMFQADNDTYVSKREQERFVQKLSPRGNVRLIRKPDTRHEIYFSKNSILEGYWEEIFDFLTEGFA